MKRVTQCIFFGIFCMLSIQVTAQNATQNLTDHFDDLIAQDVILQEDANWSITNENVSSISNLHHIYFNQTLNGIEIYGTTSSIHLLNGEIILENNQFVLKSADKLSGSSSPSLSAVDAVMAAASQLNYSITIGITVIEVIQGASQETILSNGGISLSPIPVKLVFHLTSENKLVLAWDISIQEIAQENWWSMRVDAVTGTILDKNNWIVSCSIEHNHSTDVDLDYNKNLFDIPNYKTLSEEISGCVECYEVIAMPLESPYIGDRTIESNTADPTASPYGWHDTDGAAGAEFTVTRGNNVNAYENGNNSGYQPDGGADLNFTGYPFEIIYTVANQYEDASITNLFYWNNIIELYT